METLYTKIQNYEIIALYHAQIYVTFLLGFGIGSEDMGHDTGCTLTHMLRLNDIETSAHQ